MAELTNRQQSDSDKRESQQMSSQKGQSAGRDTKQQDQRSKVSAQNQSFDEDQDLGAAADQYTDHPKSR